jgi:hypothetical protein
MRYLISTTEVYRVDTMDHVEVLRAEVEDDPHYNVSSFSYKYKCKKEKGEIVDEWYQVSVKKNFNDEKDPDSHVGISYEVV